MRLDVEPSVCLAARVAGERTIEGLRVVVAAGYRRSSYGTLESYLVTHCGMAGLRFSHSRWRLNQDKLLGRVEFRQQLFSPADVLVIEV